MKRWFLSVVEQIYPLACCKKHKSSYVELNTQETAINSIEVIVNCSMSSTPWSSLPQSGHNSHAPLQNGSVNGYNVYVTLLPSESQYSTSSRVKCSCLVHTSIILLFGLHTAKYALYKSIQKCQSVRCTHTWSTTMLTVFINQLHVHWQAVYKLQHITQRAHSSAAYTINFTILHYWASCWLCLQAVPWPTQLFHISGSGQGWHVVVPFGDQLFYVGLFLCHKKLVSVVGLFLVHQRHSRLHSKLSMLFILHHELYSPHISLGITVQFWPHTITSPLTHLRTCSRAVFCWLSLHK